MFTWLGLIGSALTLPCAVLILRGSAPRRLRHLSIPWAIQVRGVAMLVLWAGGLIGALVHRSELDHEDASFTASTVASGFTLFALGLICGSLLAERFFRQAVAVVEVRGDGSDR